MKLAKDFTEDIFKEVRISVREITFFNPLEYRPNSTHPLTFKVKYQIQGKPPLENGGLGKAIIMKEAEEIINISFLLLSESDQQALYDLTYGMKSLFEKRIADHEGISSDQEDEDESSPEAD